MASQLQALFTLCIGLGIGFGATWKISLVVLATFPLNIAAGMLRMKEREGQLCVSSHIYLTDIFHLTSVYSEDSEGKEVQGSGEHGGVISSAFTHMRTVSALSMQHTVNLFFANIYSTCNKFC